MSATKLNNPTEVLISRIKSGIASSQGGGAESGDGSGWAFGSKPSISSSSFTPIPGKDLQIDSGGTRGLNGFWDGGSGSQSIVVNMSTTPINSHGLIPPGVMRVHPSYDGPDLTLRYVASIAGQYQLAGRLTDIDPGGGDGVGLIVTQNSPTGGYPTYYLEKYIDNGGGDTFDITIPLNTGDYFDVSVDRRGTWYYDSTNLEFTNFVNLDANGASPTPPANPTQNGQGQTNAQSSISPISYYSFNDAIFTEGGNGSITVTRTGDLTSQVTINFSSKAIFSTAIAGLDYLLLANSTTFNIGSDTATIPFSVVDDNNYEVDETLQIEGVLITSQGSTTGSHQWLKNLSSILIKDNDKQQLPSPEIKKASIKDNIITLGFNLELNTSKPDPNLFSILAGNEAIDVTKTSISASTGIINLELSRAAIPGEAINLVYTDLSGDQTDGIIEGKDGADVATFQRLLDNVSRDEQPPTLDNAIANGSLVELSFNEELSPLLPALSRFGVTQNNLKIPVKSALIDATNGQLQLILSKPLAPRIPVLLSYTDIAGNQTIGVIQDRFGNDLQSFSGQPVDNQSVISQSPLKLDSAEADGNSVMLNFDRELDSAIPSTRFFAISVNGKPAKIVKANTVVADRQVVLTLDKPVYGADKLTVSYSDAKGDQATGIIQDAEGNDLESFIQVPIKNNTLKQNTLVIQSSEIAGKILRLVMSEPIASTSISSSRFTIIANGKKQAITSIQTTPQDGVIDINLQNIVETGSKVKLEYSDSDGDQAAGVVQDSDGNDLGSVKNLAITNFSTDDNAPILIDAFIEGNDLTLLFDELIAGGSITNSRFVVKVDGKRVKVSSARTVEADSTVLLSLAAMPSDFSSASISYVDPRGNQSTGVIQDILGNDLASLRDFAVDIIN